MPITGYNVFINLIVVGKLIVSCVFCVYVFLALVIALVLAAFAKFVSTVVIRQN